MWTDTRKKSKVCHQQTLQLIAQSPKVQNIEFYDNSFSN